MYGKIIQCVVAGAIAAGGLAAAGSLPANAAAVQSPDERGSAYVTRQDSDPGQGR
ncbi:hypothetical protein GCM10011583_40590 [Streptomyces camponoticapitis]|uniref:Uncharacterized protein n=1 Tax=Streptomyces camponoticapitis TaxID=1616125 RepID=A0ABQ2EDW8_9ACTN|nr:hypothetical protein [Streptomyces camponoticapitis]GGK04726.1 hypothetical protein GCM10011583_40590 [Streptomyces camponoticapitis]